MKLKTKINFKDKKYIVPLLILPFILFIGWQVIKFMDKKGNGKIVEKQEELSTVLGEVTDSILAKNDAYDQFYKTRDNRTMIEGFDNESDSVLYYAETLNDEQRRLIDSLEVERKKEEERKRIENSIGVKKSYYKSTNNRLNEEIDEDEKDYQRSLEIIKMLNGNSEDSDKIGTKQEQKNDNEEEYDPLKIMREQMLFMDSLENSKDPERKKLLETQEKLKRDEEQMEAYLNSTFNVSKKGTGGAFNHISSNKQTNLIKAVIDENITGYLGSRIRIRLLEDVFVGDTKMPKGTILYSLISGFSLQRVELNVVSVVLDGDIFPINLSVYDNDGMKGLYVPRSAFREMLREIGSNTNYLQGTSMTGENQSFYSSFLTGVLNSASQTIAKVIKSNKVKLKYNSYVFLINEKQLKNKKQ